MAQLVAEAVSLAGATPSMVAASAGGDSFNNDGNTMFKVTNGSTSAVTVTIDSPLPCNFGYNHNVIVNVAAGATVDLGPFAPSRCNDQTGNVNVAYSLATSVTVAAVRI